MPRSKARWCDRALLHSPLYYALCTTERQFRGELKRAKLPRDEWPKFMSGEHSNATVHYIEHGATKRPFALVCVPVNPDYNGVQVAALLVHEAVHLWQWICDELGEQRPGSESEAYAIQNISQNLMEAYAAEIAP